MDGEEDDVGGADFDARAFEVAGLEVVIRRHGALILPLFPHRREPSGFGGFPRSNFEGAGSPPSRG